MNFQVFTSLFSRLPSKCSQEKLLIFPGLTWLFIFFVLPGFILLDFSFREKLGNTISPHYTLATYKKVFFSGYNHLILKSLAMSAKATLATLCFALPASLYLGKASATTRRIALIAISVPFWTSFLVRIFAWKTLLHPEGLLKSLLYYCGFIEQSTLLLYNDNAVLAVIVYTSLPFALFPLISAVEKFDWQIIEAAQDMGASPIKAIFRIFMPAIRPALLAAAFMIFIPNLGAYVIPELIGGANGYLIGSRILHHSVISQDLPSASALSTFLTIIALAVIALALYLLNRRVKKQSSPQKNRTMTLQDIHQEGL